MDMLNILDEAVTLQASDIFIVAGLPVTYKVNGKQQRTCEHLSADETKNLINDLYTIAHRDNKLGISKFEDDYSFALAGKSRFRVNTFIQRGSFSAIIRVIAFGIPDAKDLFISDTVLSQADNNKGLVLVTGATGSGKSTTVACMIDRINKNMQKNIICLEDPIEYVHRHDKSIVIQREISTDSNSYLDALRSALRESPDVILVGEMRDAETMTTTMTAAETGKLVISSLHTISASDTIDRIVDSFPANQQSQIRIQLSRVLKCIISQQLVNGLDGKQYPVFEVMIMTPAIRNLIREGKTYQLTSFISEGKKLGMCTMNDSLLNLVNQNLISKDEAIAHSEEPGILINHFK